MNNMRIELYIPETSDSNSLDDFMFRGQNNCDYADMEDVYDSDV